MTDRYAQLVNTPIGKLVTKQIGLPQPSPLERYKPNGPVVSEIGRASCRERV